MPTVEEYEKAYMDEIRAEVKSLDATDMSLRLNRERRSMETGEIRRAGALDFHPNVRRGLNFAKELTGLAASERVANKIGIGNQPSPLSSVITRPI